MRTASILLASIAILSTSLAGAAAHGPAQHGQSALQPPRFRGGAGKDTMVMFEQTPLARRAEPQFNDPADRKAALAAVLRRTAFVPKKCGMLVPSRNFESRVGAEDAMVRDWSPAGNFFVSFIMADHQGGRTEWPVVPVVNGRPTTWVIAGYSGPKDIFPHAALVVSCQTPNPNECPYVKVMKQGNKMVAPNIDDLEIRMRNANGNPSKFVMHKIVKGKGSGVSPGTNVPLPIYTVSTPVQPMAPMKSCAQ